MSDIIQKLNQLLAPVTGLMTKYKKYIGYALLVLSFVSLIGIFLPRFNADIGNIALYSLWIILFLPIFFRVFGLDLARVLMPLRKELGIFMGTTAFVHGAGYIFQDPTYISDPAFWIDGGTVSYTALGVVALILTIPLLLTSNTWSMKKLGKHWKTLHRIVYAIAIFTVAHVVVYQSFAHLEYGQLIILALYFALKILEWRGYRYSLIKKTPQARGQKWLCVPCDYIYDPAIGDEDSGIAPGTDFVDIPDSWRCPVCGVTKADFVPYTGSAPSTRLHDAVIVQKNSLNPTTIELIIETTENFESKPGQFVSFVWQDAGGEFSRSYSIAFCHGKQMGFLIRLMPDGRGSALLRDITVGALIQIRGVFGHFALQDTPYKKVFIATGTGLAPIYNMICSLDTTIPKALYFSVATENDLFYTNELRKIPGLDLHIHVTRESIDGYETGRVDVSTIPATPDTEWYICGNPSMLRDATGELQTRGYTHIYYEKF